MKNKQILDTLLLQQVYTQTYNRVREWKADLTISVALCKIHIHSSFRSWPKIYLNNLATTWTPLLWTCNRETVK